MPENEKAILADKIAAAIDSLDGDASCDYCKHSGSCSGAGVRCYGGDPVFPPCCDDESDDWFDYDAYLEAQDED